MGSKKVSRTPTAKKGNHKASGAAERETSGVGADPAICAKCGQVHEGCRAHTKHGPNTGKPCGMKPRLGSLVCVKHGGNHPDHKKKAEERLREMVDPALAELRKIIDRKGTTDADKLRAIQMVLDRTGFKSGVEVTVRTEWDDVLKDAFGAIDREGIEAPDQPAVLPTPSGDEASWEDVAQAQADARSASWREYDAEDDDEYERRPNFRNGRTVRGEVVDDGDLLPDPLKAPYGPSEYDRDPTAWPYDLPPAP